MTRSLLIKALETKEEKPCPIHREDKYDKPVLVCYESEVQLPRSSNVQKEQLLTPPKECTCHGVKLDPVNRWEGKPEKRSRAA